MITQTLRTIQSQLKLTAVKPFYRGDVDDYYNWSNQMVKTIEVVTPLLSNASEGISAMEARIAALEASIAEKDKIILALATKSS